MGRITREVAFLPNRVSTASGTPPLRVLEPFSCKSQGDVRERYEETIFAGKRGYAPTSPSHYLLVTHPNTLPRFSLHVPTPMRMDDAMSRQ